MQKRQEFAGSLTIVHLILHLVKQFTHVHDPERQAREFLKILNV